MAAKGSKAGPATTVGFRSLLREAVLGYVYWSLVLAVAPAIWYYPLQELSVTGYEAFALVKLSPLLLGIGPLHRLLQWRWSMAVLRLGSVACLASFQAPTTLQRLIILCAGCALILLVWTLSLWSSSPQQRTSTFWGMMLGFFAYIVSRIWFVSFLPTWWDETSNLVVIGIAAIATLDKIESGEDSLRGPTMAKADRPKWFFTALGSLFGGPTTPPHWFFTALGLASLLFVTHYLFSEVSVVTRWVVSGFPDPGPMPHPWGAVILLALWFGLMLSPCNHVVTSVIWWVIGTAGFAALLYLPTWLGFVGGVVLAVYIMSLWPLMIDRVTHCPPGRTLAVVGLVHIALLLLSVWTVAYNFVPGGEYTREHMDWVVAICVVFLGLGTLTGRRYDNKSPTAFVSIRGKKLPDKKVHTLLFLTVLVGLAGFAVRYNPEKYVHPPKEHPKADFTAAIWSYRFGYDNNGWPSVARAANFLEESGADLIVLLESDASKPFLGNNDLGMWLGERLGMYVDFGVSSRDHTWGNLLLSKYPFVKSKHHMLPSPHGELAPGVTATVNMTGHLVDFVTAHMGNDRDVLDRELQAKTLARELKNAENPVVFLGYVTSLPFSRDYKELTLRGSVKDIDDTDTERWCEYIMYRGLVRLGYARVSHAGISDTEIQMARFRFPENPENFKDNNIMVKGHSKVEPDVQFSKRFGDYSEGHNWIWDHKYHMSTPKYFT